MSSPDPVDHRAEFIHEQELLRTTMIAGLMGVASELAQSAQELIRSSVLSRVQRWVLGSIMAILLITVVVSAVGVWTLRDFAQANKTNTTIIRDCTDPKGQCFKDGQARTADAVGNINKVVVLAAACAKVPSNVTQDQIEACVKKGLLK